ncbi:MAG TPA: caspase family protein [Thermoguttaceae bacterium]|nr:caspase family protein [Thermoguttaceae bacterium]
MRPVTRTASRLPRGRGARIARALAAATALSACLLPNVARSAGKAPPKTAHACVNIEGHTAPVRAIGFTPDSKLLCTAGLDKVVHVWSLPQPGVDGGVGRAKGVMVETWGKVRTLRWPMGRGPRGMIYAMAVHPTNGRLVIGGYGNLQLTGEIVQLDPYLGQWVDAKYKHFFATIGALSYSASGSWLASIDGNGRAFLWSSAGGEPRELAPPHADRPLQYPRIAIVGDAMVVLPVHDRDLGPGQSIWKLRTYDVARGAFGNVLAADHHGEVTALTASRDGRYFASADDAGNLFVWRPGEVQPWKSLRAGFPVVSMAFSPDGGTLAAGTRLVPGAAATEMQVWDVAAGALLRKRQLADDVNACAISPDGRRLAYAGGEGYEVFVESMAPPYDVLTLPGGKRVAEVAFAVDGTADYNVVFTSLPASLLGGERRTFSVAGLKATDEAPPAIESSQFLGQWSYLAKLERDPYRLWLYRGQHAQGSVRLDKQHGHLISQCWIPGPGGEPAAVAVGTAVENGVFVYALPRGGECDQLLYCRGHSGRVTSVAASPDGRYLLSGSTDGTVRYWPLRACWHPSPVFRRWGADLQPSASGRALVVSSIDDLGPLYQKGVRAGDQIDKIEWNVSGNQADQRSENRSSEMLRQLGQLPWDQQVTFTTSRDGTELRFNLRGGWHPMLTLYAIDSEWIAWTPAGYYACSPGGERLMGWLVNPTELNQPPEFYTAEQFNRAFYQPDVIRKLLREGSLEGAIAMTEDVREEDRVEAPMQIEPPKVWITAPTQRTLEVRDEQVTIHALAEAKGGRPITAMRLQVDGRPYEKKGYERGISRERLRKSESWTLKLPPGEHTIQVVAESDTSKGQSEMIFLRCLGPAVEPTLYVLAIGISEYRGNMALRYGHSDAEQVVGILNDRSKELFGNVHVKAVTNQDATKSAIIDGFQWLRDNMKQLDVGLVFYSGHGVQDDQGRFYLFPVDGSLDDMPGTCVPDAIVKQYCESTVGKLVFMVDACHSGGIDLTASGRAPVDDLARDFSRSEYSVIMMASSTGKEVSFERDDWGGGAFTKAVGEGLTGNANFAMPLADDVILTAELDLYVYTRVSQLTEGRQTPVSSKPAIPPFALTRILTARGQ